MPFYSMDELSAWQIIVNCNFASLGDAGLMVFAYIIASLAANGCYWLRSPKQPSLMVFLGTGQIVPFAIKFVALRVPWGWNYPERMLILWGIGVILPIMWEGVPQHAVGLTACSLREPPVDQ